MTEKPAICIAVLAHNEAQRIARCLASLPLDAEDIVIHVVVNGSSDATAAIARRIAQSASNLIVHDYPEGGKSRSWNRFTLDELPGFCACHVFIDGDAQIQPGSIEALARALAENPLANAAAGMPANGRRMADYRVAMIRDHGMFGDLYALRGSFLARMKEAGIRLPGDLIGDDSLLGALAKCDLGDESQWADDRIIVCEDAGFLCDSINPLSPADWRLQYRRMINYSVRHFQNKLISTIMKRDGARGLPAHMAELYAAELSAMRPRGGVSAWFDRMALKRMATAAQTIQA